MLVKQSELDSLLKKLREENKTIVTTNGCFDILHVGHVRYLEKTKTLENQEKSEEKINSGEPV